MDPQRPSKKETKMAKQPAPPRLPERNFAELYREVQSYLEKPTEAKKEDLQQALEQAQSALAEKEAELARMSRRMDDMDYDRICLRRDLEEARAVIASQALQISELIRWKREKQRANKLRRSAASLARDDETSSAAATFSSTHAD
jgi:hypothetical protein